MKRGGRAAYDEAAQRAGGAANTSGGYASQPNMSTKEGRRQLQAAGPLVSGGGVAATPYGEGNPNAMPLWNPFSRGAGAGSAYRNLLVRPSAAGAGTMDALQGRVSGDLAAGPVNRAVPADFAAQAQARDAQMGAVQGVGAAGQDMAAMQRNLARGALTRGAGAAAHQGALLRDGAGVGALGGGYQGGLMGHLTAQATGAAGPTAAEGMMRRNLDQAARQQAGMAAGVRGGGSAGAAGMAARSGEDVLLRGAADTSMLRAQEQQAAQQLLGDVANQSRAGDVSAFSARGDVANQARTAALAETLGAADIVGATRGQDVGQAATAAQLLEGVRGQDITAATNQGALGLEGRALDDAATQNTISNMFGLHGAQLGGAQVDANMLLGAGGQADAAQLGSLGVHEQIRNNKDFTKQLIGGAFGAGSGALGMLPWEEWLT
jgi:hypothetical protein